MTESTGIDRDAVTGWYVEHITGSQPPLTFELIAGGNSNLTYKVTDANGRATVLRRPPLGQVLASAHDMNREYTILTALECTDVPVARTHAFEPSHDVNGAPFYVMDHVHGLVVRDQATASLLPVGARTHASDSLVDVLLRIHAVDPDSVGLGELGRRGNYIERQLRRWYGQWEKSKTRDLPDIDRVYMALESSVPAAGPAAIVHGDYKLENCIVGNDGEIRAVLDWELCTLGDPLADLGLLMVYWNGPNDDALIPDATTAIEGMKSRSELLNRYSAGSPRDLSNIDFYVAFGYWKLACIVEGVYARFIGGSMGQRDSNDFQPFARQVEMLAKGAVAAVERMN